MTVQKGNWDKLVRKVRRAVVRDDPDYYDMFENQGEAFFARLYLQQIKKVLSSCVIGSCLQILDAGCQAGRLAIPLALAGHRVTGVDTSDLALRRAKRHAQGVGVQLELIQADLSRWLPQQMEGSFDGVVCTEVLYLRKNYRALLEGLIRVVRPGGLCFISHRPTSYYLAEAFQKKDYQAVEMIRSHQEGSLWGSYYNWQDRKILQELYKALHVKVIEITSIGFFSWLAVNPEDLNAEDRDLLFAVDSSLFCCSHEGGRYLLVSSAK